jgi:Arc/MetJ-type ribon-helix-helix transcriptional regulator
MVDVKWKTITVRITPEQYAALREEATRRAVESGGIADASSVVRELLARWMDEAKPKRRK